MALGDVVMQRAKEEDHAREGFAVAGTRAAVREELECFAEHVMKRQFAELAERVNADIRELLARPTLDIPARPGSASSISKVSRSPEVSCPIFRPYANSEVRPWLVEQSTQDAPGQISGTEGRDLIGLGDESRELLIGIPKSKPEEASSQAPIPALPSEKVTSKKMPPALKRAKTNGFQRAKLMRTCTHVDLLTADEDEQITALIDEDEPHVKKAPSFSSHFDHLDRVDHSKGNEEPVVRSPYRRRARIFLLSRPFEGFSSLIIVFNAFFIGFVANLMAKDKLDKPPAAVQTFEYMFLTWFFFELSARFYAFGWPMFNKRIRGKPNPDGRWNTLDVIVVGLQCVEVLASLMSDFNGLNTSGNAIGVMRLLRLFKILRVVRLLKVMKSVGDLRMIVYSVVRSISLFFWSVCAVVIVTFFWGVYLTDLVRDHRVKHADAGNSVEDKAFELYFGDLGTSMLTLTWCVTGGEDWGTVYNTLSKIEQSFLATQPLLCYIYFASLALMNVITGVFLQTAMERAKNEKETFLVSNAKRVFKSADMDDSGMISWKDFQGAIETSSMHDFFEAIDIDIMEAKNLFELLDISGDGSISTEEFLTGCLRVRGPAKALDLLVLSREVGYMFEHFQLSIERNAEKIQTNTEIAERNAAKIHRNASLIEGERKVMQEIEREVEFEQQEIVAVQQGKQLFPFDGNGDQLSKVEGQDHRSPSETPRQRFKRKTSLETADSLPGKIVDNGAASNLS